MTDSHFFIHSVIFVFKLFEPFFWFVQVFIALNLFKARYFFEANVKMVNKLIRYQGFDSQLEITDKAFSIWRRDLKVLFFLNLLIVVLIHLI